MEFRRVLFRSRYHTRLAGGIPAACASLARVHASARGLQTHRDSYAKRQSPRKRAFRVCPAPLQAHLREGRRAGRNPQARVLREADPGAQAQGRRRRETPGAPPPARRPHAPAPILRQKSAERAVGKERVRYNRLRWTPKHYKKKTQKQKY